METYVRLGSASWPPRFCVRAEVSLERGLRPRSAAGCVFFNRKMRVLREGEVRTRRPVPRGLLSGTERQHGIADSVWHGGLKFRACMNRKCAFSFEISARNTVV